MKNELLTITIVIPVYNEERYLKACLDSIKLQTIKPDEVIVVDNNSTDKSVEIAKKYSFAKIIREENQGIVHARDCGFNQVSSNIIGRIDADTHLASNWVEEVLKYFSQNHKVSAITGDCYVYDFPLSVQFHYLHKFTYYVVQKWIAGTNILWGSNMAIRQSAWQNVKKMTSKAQNMHEDVDLSLKLKVAGLKIAHVKDLKAEVSLRRGDLGVRSLNQYLSAWHHTYVLNRLYVKSILILVLGVITFLSVLAIQPFKRFIN